MSQGAASGVRKIAWTSIDTDKLIGQLPLVLLYDYSWLKVFIFFVCQNPSILALHQQNH